MCLPPQRCRQLFGIFGKAWREFDQCSVDASNSQAVSANVRQHLKHTWVGHFWAQCGKSAAMSTMLCLARRLWPRRAGRPSCTSCHARTPQHRKRRSINRSLRKESCQHRVFRSCHARRSAKAARRSRHCARNDTPSQVASRCVYLSRGVRRLVGHVGQVCLDSGQFWGKLASTGNVDPGAGGDGNFPPNVTVPCSALRPACARAPRSFTASGRRAPGGRPRRACPCTTPRPRRTTAGQPIRARSAYTFRMESISLPPHSGPL